MELTSVQIGLLMIALVVVLMVLGMPIGVTMISAGFLGLFLIRGIQPAYSALGFITWRQGINEILLVIPLFTWMGMLAARGGISEDAFSSLYKWVGQLKGGLAMACTAACTAFGAVCGNHIATAVTMSSVALPEMRKYKYKDEFSLGCIAASGNLGIMIPPSGAFVIYGFLTETSIGSLFIAGVLPGLLIMILFIIQISFQCRLNPATGPAGPNVGWIERLKSTRQMVAIVVVFIIVMGGIYAGFFTPGEAAACGCFAVLLIGIAKRQLNFKNLVKSLHESLLITAMIMLMLIGAMIFGSFLTTSGIPSALTVFVNDLELNRYIILGVILLIYIVAGLILDIYAILVITLPIFFPIVAALGFDALHFGILCVLTIMLGSISPPFGIVVYAVSGMNRDVPIIKIFRGIVPFFITTIVGLIIVLFIPEIATLLPDYMIPTR